MLDQDACRHLFGNILRFRATPSTGAHFLVSECTTMPGAGTPPKRHPGDDEGFYILEGHYEFIVEGKTIEAGPGDWVGIPNGAQHQFRNATTEVARMLIVNAPGRLHEAYYAKLGELLPEGTTQAPAPSGPPSAPARAEMHRCAAACGVELLV
ncbi:cupin domain-containing protein [Humitalea sp. 24SJ18S-53]|uniref:cupin domain-containing protein n=1 Tax=Humitalea sp. 24SJ18S-53 TaxID=3422307 RepID=UPI003D669BC5